LLDQLLDRHGTMGQTEFFLASRGEAIAPYVESHERQRQACVTVDASLPAEQRRARVDRDDLARFLFAPDDLVIIVGQDGLVPNVAKYLRGQMVVGVNPDPARYDGVLCRHRAEGVAQAIAWCVAPSAKAFVVERRTLAMATSTGDGQTLLALNEVFVGHRTHQSARYRLGVGEKSERQSSSGIICSTGTGCTGWARSIMLQRAAPPQPSPEAARAKSKPAKGGVPGPSERTLAWFVREPFPSVTTGTSLSQGVLRERERLTITSEMGEGGVVFADGIEPDFIEFGAGCTVEVGVASHALNLVAPSNAEATGSDPTRKL
jgi:hypothetical protein